MSVTLILGIIVVYFSVLFTISYFTSKNTDTTAFFTANKRSPWWLVAFGMIGTTISGITFISVPGAVGNANFSYYMFILGNGIGFFIIGVVLMPLYYRLNLISIYSYLNSRFGFWTYKTGSGFFILSRTIGSAARLYLAVNVLHLSIFQHLGVPFIISVLISIFLIWIYTNKGGIKTIIVTDTLQTFFLLAALVTTLIMIANKLDMSLFDLAHTIKESKYSRLIDPEITSTHYWAKDFFSGIFIAVGMVGLDQDLMQKNLTCKNIGEAQKNMFWFYIVFLIINLLFLSLGAALYIYGDSIGYDFPTKSDNLFPNLALGGDFGLIAGISFLLGIIAATYASSDSALTALTTSFCIDFLSIEKFKESKRNTMKKWVHIGFCVVFFFTILIFHHFNGQELVGAVFTLAAYTYGPLLGLYIYGLYTKWDVKDVLVPIIAIASPAITYLIDSQLVNYIGSLGFANLIVNASICFLLLRITKDLKFS